MPKGTIELLKLAQPPRNHSRIMRCGPVHAQHLCSIATLLLLHMQESQADCHSMKVLP